MSEEVYFATQYLQAAGGIEITASHNPIDYNGMKIVGQGATPIGEATGLKEIQALEQGDFIGQRRQVDYLTKMCNPIIYLMSCLILSRKP